MKRNSYGQLIEAEKLSEAVALVAMAATKVGLEPAYDALDRDRKGRWSGSARHHEIYDYRLNRAGNVCAVLVCVRETEGSKHGVATVKKTYWVITRTGSKYSISEANKAIAAKACKTTNNPGDALDILEGRSKLHAASRPRLVYKRVTKTSDGRYLSLYDGTTEYRLGYQAEEIARPPHQGGIYCYLTYDEARYWECPERWPGYDTTQVVLLCEASGKTVVYDNGKRAVSRLTPIREYQTGYEELDDLIRLMAGQGLTRADR